MAKVRTQIQLEPDEHQALRALARRRRISLSHAIREMLRAALGLDAHRAERVERFLAAAGSGKEPDARRDVARKHDEILYGAPR